MRKKVKSSRKKKRRRDTEKGGGGGGKEERKAFLRRGKKFEGWLIQVLIIIDFVFLQAIFISSCNFNA